MADVASAIDRYRDERGHQAGYERGEKNIAVDYDTFTLQVRYIDAGGQDSEMR